MVTLLILLNLCHWLADYTHLSRPHMLAAKRFGKPLFPIFQHALIHALLVVVITGNGWAFLLMISSHFLIDVWKGRMNVWFPSLQNPANVFHWWVFGLDQLLHQTVIIYIAHIVT